MHCIFNIFASAGGIEIANFRYFSENLQRRLPWQLNFEFHSQNCTKLAITPIICTILSFFSAIVVISWLAISNSLPKFSRDVDMATKLWIYSIYLVKLQSYALRIQYFWICWWPSDRRFQLCYWILQGRLPWQLNFGFHSQNCTKLAITPIICTIL